MMILDFLFPRECHICGVKLSEGEKYLCTTCLASMPRSLYHTRRMNPMEQRFAGLFPFEQASGHFLYARDASVAQVVHDFKYHKFRGLARYMGHVIGRELLTTGFLSTIDCILPIPMHYFKQARRGYNPAEQVAIGIGEEVGIAVADNLKAVRSHRTQTALTLDERRENTSNLFAVKHPEELSGKHILLFDDICTTGSTLLSAAEVILAEVPTARLSLLTLGVTY